MKETPIIPPDVRDDGGRVMQKSETKMSLKEFALFVIPTVHGVEVGCRDIGEVLGGVGVQGSLSRGFGEKLVFGCSYL
jgi:hypothetical protein